MISRNIESAQAIKRKREKKIKIEFVQKIKKQYV